MLVHYLLATSLLFRIYTDFEYLAPLEQTITPQNHALASMQIDEYLASHAARYF